MAKHVIKAESIHEEQIGIKSAEVVENTKIDVVGWTNMDVDASNEIEDPDATEYSSLFASTISDAENGSEGNDDEVQPELFGENGVACPLHPFGPDVQTRCDFYSKSINFVLSCLDNYLSILYMKKDPDLMKILSKKGGYVFASPY